MKNCIIFITTPKELENLELDDNFMPKLNEYNSNIIESCIGKSKARQTYSNVLKERKDIQFFTYTDIKNIIIAIAAENSTRTPLQSIELFTDYITDTTKNFWVRLKSGCINLPDDIYNYVKDKTSRKEKSLASKICRYFNEWVYNQTNYTVNDSFVRGVLPYYLSFYNIDKDKWSKKIGKERKLKTFEDATNPYNVFISPFNLLKSNVPTLSTHQIDHILWYCFSKDSVRYEIAKGIAIKESNK